MTNLNEHNNCFIRAFEKVLNPQRIHQQKKGQAAAFQTSILSKAHLRYASPLV